MSLGVITLCHAKLYTQTWIFEFCQTTFLVWSIYIVLYRISLHTELHAKLYLYKHNVVGIQKNYALCCCFWSNYKLGNQFEYTNCATKIKWCEKCIKIWLSIFAGNIFSLQKSFGFDCQFVFPFSQCHLKIYNSIYIYI